MSEYSHLSPDERDYLANLRSEGLGCNAIARRLGRSASTISRELRRNACESGSYRPHVADGGYMLRRQRACVLKADPRLAAYVTDRLVRPRASTAHSGMGDPRIAALAP
jgi:transposase, IS30 family